MSILIKGVDMPKYCGSCFVGDRTICRGGCPLVEVSSNEEMQKYNAYQDEMGGVEAQAMMEGYENPFY